MKKTARIESEEFRGHSFEVCPKCGGRLGFTEIDLDAVDDVFSSALDPCTCRREKEEEDEGI